MHSSTRRSTTRGIRGPWPRDRRDEWMDDPSIEPRLLAWATRDLTRLGKLAGTARVLVAGVRRIAEHAGVDRDRGDVFTVADLGCGDGGITADVHARLRPWADARGLKLRTLGIDQCDASVEAARARASAADGGLEFAVHRLGRDPFPAGVDVAISSLFLHHLPDAAASTVLAEVASGVRCGAHLDDLRRSRTAWGFTWCATRALSRCPVVHADGPDSVRGAFTVAEIRRMLDDAGWRGADVRPGWPFRLRVTWVRESGP